MEGPRKKGGEGRSIRGLKERKKEVILLDIFDGSYSNSNRKKILSLS
jgi:hypothetical protein